MRILSPYLGWLWLLLLALAGCLEQPEDATSTPSTSVSAMEDLTVAPDFAYVTTQQHALTLQVYDAQDVPVPHAWLRVYQAQPDSLGALLAVGQADAHGEWTLPLSLPTYQRELLVRVAYPGIPDAYRLSVGDGPQTFVLGGAQPGQAAEVAVMDLGGAEAQAGKTSNVADKFAYLGPYDSQGVPSYLTLSRDVVTQDILDLVANSLPEGYPVPAHNPQYIADSISADTRLKDSAEVWVTFVHEGAGYRNVLGYYPYDLSAPPTSVDDIDSLYIIFPNVSFAGSGGGLQTGDKVYLGSFPANTGIGWFLVPNGWSSNQQRLRYPGTGSLKFSDKDFNTFTDPANRSHVVLLKDDNRELLLLGMEDIDRPGGDRDFNDAVFYVTASPYTAIERDNVAQAKTATGNDADGDGVIDPNDAYPNDPDRAFDLYVPGQNQYGTVAFEDLWPFRGDYDLNDLVIDYQYHLVTNTANRVTELEGTFVVKALGAALRSGFGFVLDIPPGQVASVQGSQVLRNRVRLGPNGIEQTQNRGVVIVFDDGHALMQRAGFINTEPGEPYLTPDTVRIQVELRQPQALNDLGEVPFNPFIFTERGRGYEVHLPDHPPTKLADEALFGTGNDDSDPGIGRYYKDANHLPWAIHVPAPFVYPIEQRSVIQGHLRFDDWAESSGSLFSDWYQAGAGYRDAAHLYNP